MAEKLEGTPLWDPGRVSEAASHDHEIATEPAAGPTAADIGAGSDADPTAAWFRGAGLGVFVHWDHASQQGLEISWPLVGGLPALPHCQSVTPEQYHSSAATFDPKEWDPAAFARVIKAAGATYAVLTAKHHSGYALFDTATSDFGVMASPYGRDIVAGWTSALRAEGIRVGLYYSLPDWSHPDYPAFTLDHRPYLPGTSPPLPPPEQWQAFLDAMFTQLRELLTHYGPIDLLWFDGGWERSPKQWRAAELVEMIHQLSPATVVNDRLPGQGDYATPEQAIPVTTPDGPWETCQTMNESWSFNPADTNYKPARYLVESLCEVAGRGGNLLLNVSPRGDGTLPPEQLERLAVLGAWMERNSESVVGTRPGPDTWQFRGPVTARGDRVYLHCVMKPELVVVRGGPAKKVRAVHALGTGRELSFTVEQGALERLLHSPNGELLIEVPEAAADPIVTVLAVDLEP